MAMVGQIAEMSFRTTPTNGMTQILMGMGIMQIIEQMGIGTIVHTSLEHLIGIHMDVQTKMAMDGVMIQMHFLKKTPNGVTRIPTVSGTTC